MTFVSLDPERPQLFMEANAKFHTWPSGAAGVYAVNVTFGQDGPWGVVAHLPAQSGTTGIAQTGFFVKPESSAPGIGQPVPASRSRTVREVPDLKMLTSSAIPDPDLYQLTIAEAVASGIPTVVTFGTPAFCETATCGPQVEVVSRLKDQQKGEANFIHVEVYDNPQEMLGDISRGRLSPLMDEWGLATEPFTFVLDGNGLVVARFEGFVTEDELGTALRGVLKP